MYKNKNYTIYINSCYVLKIKYINFPKILAKIFRNLLLMITLQKEMFWLNNGLNYKIIHV